MKYKCLNLEERQIIETMYTAGAKPVEIAQSVSKSLSTIYRELKRGKPDEMSSCCREGYRAKVADDRVNQAYKNRGRRKINSIRQALMQSSAVETCGAPQPQRATSKPKRGDKAMSAKGLKLAEYSDTDIVNEMLRRMGEGTCNER